MRDKKGARARRLSSQQVRADIYSRKGESQLEAIARLDREIQAEQTRDALLRAGMVV
jgi:predicted dinucleotide-binding enzyme